MPSPARPHPHPRDRARERERERQRRSRATHGYQVTGWCAAARPAVSLPSDFFFASGFFLWVFIFFFFSVAESRLVVECAGVAVRAVESRSNAGPSGLARSGLEFWCCCFFPRG